MHRDVFDYLSSKGHLCSYNESDDTISINVVVEERSIELIMKFPRFYPYEFPEIYCYQDLDFRMPHVYTSKQLCLYDENEEIADPQFFLEISTIMVDRAIKLLTDSINGDNFLEYNVEAISYWNSKSDALITMLNFDDSYSHFIIGYCLLDNIYICADSHEDIVDFVKYKYDIEISEEDMIRILYVKSKLVITSCIRNLRDIEVWLIGQENKSVFNNFLLQLNEQSIIVSQFDNGKGNCLLGIKLGRLKSNGIVINKKNVAGVIRANSGKKFEKIQIRDMRMKRLFTRGGDGRAVFDKKCLFVGCGSVGSFLIKAVTEIGISDDISIVDKDILSPDNIARHLCGASYILCDSKATAVGKYMKDMYPTIKCNSIHKNVLELIENKRDFFSEYDLVFVTVGNSVLEKEFVQLFKQGNLKQCIIVWVEPYLIAGHAVILNSEVNDFTYNNIFDAQGRFNISVIEDSKKYLKSEAGCQSAYAPYAGFEVQKFVLDFIDIYYKEIYEKKNKGNYIFTWFGKMKWARQNQITIKPEYRAIDDRSIRLKRIDVE